MNDQAFTGKSSNSVDIIRADPAVFRSLALTFSTNVKSRAINVVLAKRRRAELKAARDAARDARREAARRAEELAKRLAEQKPKWKEAWEEEPKPDQEWEADWEGKGDAIASSSAHLG